MLLGYKPVQRVTVLNTVGNCNTMLSIIIYYNIILKYNLMEPPSYMRSVFDRNVVKRRIPDSYGGAEKKAMYEIRLLAKGEKELVPNCKR